MIKFKDEGIAGDAELMKGLRMLPNILDDYLKRRVNQSIVDIFLVLMHRLLEIKILEQKDVEHCDIFGVLKRAIENQQNR